jgi:D-ribose pyranose/furanose isomerase RbsD
LAKEVDISDLRLSSKTVGKLYPVLLDRDGNVIDGKHRLAADESWPKIKLEHVGCERERLLARLISNVCRRTVSSSEKSDTLARLGRIYLEAGERPGKLAYRIAQETGMSYRWVMKYLPDDLKARPGLGGPSLLRAQNLYKYKDKSNVCKVAHSATLDFDKLVSMPQTKTLVVRTYTNANFVNLALEKTMYQDFERVAERLGSTAETIICNAMILILKEIEKISIPLSPDVAKNRLCTFSSRKTAGKI